MTISDQLRAAYAQSGRTQAAIASHAGVAENTVLRVLTGGNCTVDSMVAVAAALGVEVLHIDPTPRFRGRRGEVRRGG